MMRLNLCLLIALIGCASALRMGEAPPLPGAALVHADRPFIGQLDPASGDAIDWLALDDLSPGPRRIEIQCTGSGTGQLALLDADGRIMTEMLLPFADVIAITEHDRPKWLRLTGQSGRLDYRIIWSRERQ